MAFASSAGGLVASVYVDELSQPRCFFRISQICCHRDSVSICMMRLTGDKLDTLACQNLDMPTLLYPEAAQSSRPALHASTQTTFDMCREESGLYPEQAAKLWPKLAGAAQKLGLRLGSPAAAPCGANCNMRSPFEWYAYSKLHDERANTSAFPELTAIVLKSVKLYGLGCPQ